MIIKSNSYYKNFVRGMWDEIFNEDSQKFRDFYFKRKYSHNNTFIYLKDSTPVSSLQNLDYDFLFDGKSYKISYISGACTLKEYRGNGYMNELLKETFRENYKENKVFSSLIPASDSLFDYYERFGYKTSSYIKKYACKNNSSYNENDFEIINDFYNFKFIYNKNISDCSIYLNEKNSRDYFEFMKNENGFAICKGINLAIIFKRENDYFVDFSSFDDETLKSILNNNFEVVKSEFVTPFGMIRITNINIFLEMIKKYIREDLLIEIFDDIILENNCVFKKENNKIVFENRKISEEKYKISVDNLLFNFLNGISDKAFNFNTKQNIKMYMMMN